MLLAQLMPGQQELTSECFQHAAKVKNACPRLGASPASLSSSSRRHLFWEYLTSSPVSIVGKKLIINVASKIITEMGGRKMKTFRPCLELNSVPKRFMSTQNLKM